MIGQWLATRCYRPETSWAPNPVWSTSAKRQFNLRHGINWGWIVKGAQTIQTMIWWWHVLTRRMCFESGNLNFGRPGWCTLRRQILQTPTRWNLHNLLVAWTPPPLNTPWADAVPETHDLPAPWDWKSKGQNKAGSMASCLDTVSYPPKKRTI